MDPRVRQRLYAFRPWGLALVAASILATPAHPARAVSDFPPLLIEGEQRSEAQPLDDEELSRIRGRAFTAPAVADAEAKRRVILWDENLLAPTSDDSGIHATPPTAQSTNQVILRGGW